MVMMKNTIHTITNTFSAFALCLAIGCGGNDAIYSTETDQPADPNALAQNDAVDNQDNNQDEMVIDPVVITPVEEEEEDVVEELPPVEEELPPVEEEEELPPEEEVPPPVETLAEAPFDNDNILNPAQYVFLRNTGLDELTHTNDISWPAGDLDDWVSFEYPNNSNPTQYTWLTLDCQIEGQQDAIIRAKIWEDGVATTKSVRCNEGEQRITIDNTKLQTVQIYFAVVAEPTYVSYTFHVRGFLF